MKVLWRKWRSKNKRRWKSVRWWRNKEFVGQTWRNVRKGKLVSGSEEQAVVSEIETERLMEQKKSDKRSGFSKKDEVA